ncbi:hypothetical protein G6011_00986 [Alternaria panax]|uniref:Uncharacterized protein n=1 Tax=Alternaria panax TaxID=48097 RepID=A0AAD4NW59_9PLEO|nr:hypothetical protein G6011_00986 [Alternaria panax]
MAGEAVAWLQIQLAGGNVCGAHGGRIEVCGNEQFYLGRDPELCRYSWSDDLTISRKHMRIHCILYEQDPVAKIAPFVYVTDISANGTYLRKSNLEYTASQDAGILIGHKSTFLLEDGDEIRISETVTLVYCSKMPVELVKLTAIQERERQTFASRYLLTGRLLGEGGYGKVIVGINQETQRQLACKMIRLDKIYDTLAMSNLQKSERKQLPTRVTNCFREFDILKDLSHPNIIAIEKVFQSSNTIYIFEELVTGGDLFSFIEFKDGRIGGLHAAAIIYQVLKGMEYLHNQDIVHRDLKPDNILMSSLEDGARVVITDFGSARFLPGKNSQNPPYNDKYHRMFSYVGTLEYTAPEIYRLNKTIPVDDGYSKAVDMWSIGSITATVLTGDLMFSDRRHPGYDINPQGVIMGLAAICDLSNLGDPHHPSWANIGYHPKDFIKSLLVLNEEERMTASEALAHEWFSSYSEDFEDVYAKTIADWKPREKNLNLVDIIPKSGANRIAAGLIGSYQSPKTTSRHFVLRQSKAKPQNISSPQRWRANTPLPSIMQDREAAQFASQVQASSYDEDAQIHRQRKPAKATTTGMYHATEDAGHGSDGFEKSSNGVTNNYSQQGYYEYLPPPPHSYPRNEHDSVLVGETPINTYHQRQWTPNQDQDSVLVLETPPEYLRLHESSSGDGLPVCDVWLRDDAADVDGDMRVARKRRKPSHSW